MARASYLARRDGRYFMQARFAVQCAPLVGNPLYRAALGTSDYRAARSRLIECLGWFHRMNDSADYPSLIEKNVAQLRAYLQDAWPISDERLFARRSYEELLKNLILSFLTGVRPGEIGQVEHDDIKEDGGIYYLHLRGFDPSKGRAATKDMKRFKTASAHRIIPLHPLIIDLGLLERIEELRKIGCPVLFPEWEPYSKPGGELRRGQPLSKSFQYLKKKAKLERFETAPYSARHWFAGLLDRTDIKQLPACASWGTPQGRTRRPAMAARHG